jgi:hypothetical protein
MANSSSKNNKTSEEFYNEIKKDLKQLSNQRIGELKHIANKLYENQINDKDQEKAKYNLEKLTADALNQFMPKELLTKDFKKFKSLVEIAELKLIKSEGKMRPDSNKK